MASENQNKAPSSPSKKGEQMGDYMDELRKNLEALKEKFAKEEADKLEMIEELKRSKQELASAEEEIQSLYPVEMRTIEANKRLQDDKRLLDDVNQLLGMVNEKYEKLWFVEAEHLSLKKKYEKLLE